MIGRLKARTRAAHWLIAAIVFTIAPLAGATESISVAGASTLLPAIREAAKAYSEKTGVKIEVTGGGSSIGISSVLSGHADIGMVSRELSADERSKLTPFLLGHDTVVPIVHAANPVQSLSHDQLASIFKGQPAHWKTFGGNDQQITVLVKKHGRSTRQIWDVFFALDGKTPEAAHQTGANLAMLLFVAADNSAIGYVSAGTVASAQLRGIQVRELRIDGHPAATARSPAGQVLSRELNLVTAGNPRPVVRRFIEYTRSEDGGEFLRKQGFLVGGSAR